MALPRRGGAPRPNTPLVLPRLREWWGHQAKLSLPSRWSWEWGPMGAEGDRQGCRGAGVQGFGGAETQMQGFGDAEVQGFRGTGTRVQGCRHSGVQAFKGAGIWGCRDSGAGVWRFGGAGVHGCRGCSNADPAMARVWFHSLTETYSDPAYAFLSCYLSPSALQEGQAPLCLLSPSLP